MQWFQPKGFHFRPELIHQIKVFILLFPPLIVCPASAPRSDLSYWNTKCYCGLKRIPLVLLSFPFPFFFTWNPETFKWFLSVEHFPLTYLDKSSQTAEGRWLPPVLNATCHWCGGVRCDCCHCHFSAEIKGRCCQSTSCFCPVYLKKINKWKLS